MKKKYTFWAAASVLVLSLLLLIALLPIDSELDSEPAAWGDAANDTGEVAGNGYYYLMGIMAAPEEDPAVAGRALIEAYLISERKFLDGVTAEFTGPEYPAAKRLGHLTGDYYCMLKEAGCFARLIGDPVSLRRELAAHAVLLQRYRRLLEFAELKPLTQPTFYEIIPPYRYLIDGHRVHQLSVILAQRSGDRAAALEMLRLDMEHSRRHMASARSLLGKMVMLSIYADDLDLMLRIAAPGAAPALTADERSLRMPLTREFGSILNFHRHLRAHPASFEETAGSSYGWLLRNTVRTNMSANAMFPYFHEIAGLSALDPAAFNALAAAGDLPVFEAGFSLRNAGGSILNSLAAPALVPYIARLHDVDCKIALVNAALPLDEAAWRKILDGDATLAAVNPYRPQERPYADRETGVVCFSGPFPDEQKHRCIRRYESGDT